MANEDLMSLTVDERAKVMGKLGQCKGHFSQGHDALPSDLHFRRDDCVEWREAAGRDVAEDTFARF